LGASVNLLLYLVYQQLGLEELKPTKVTLQLVNKSIKIPRGEIKDVLIKVDEFIFPMDFIILDTEPMTNHRGQIPVILRRPFLATFYALINCNNSLTKLTFENMTVNLNIFNLEGQNNDQSTEPFEVNMIQGLSSEYFKEDQMDTDVGRTYQIF